ncbi:MAG TPA: tetratricopeptide repeat protein [Polyangia bacterium]|nr:tetratricopeptide repeat protein [Polyangia bacterium]
MRILSPAAVAVLAHAVLALAPGQDALAGRDPARSAKLYEQGYRAAGNGEIAQAATFFKQALDADPSNLLAAFDLGGAYADLGDKDHAIVFYEKTVKLRPDFSEAHNQLGTLYLLHRNDNDRAIAHFRTALLTPKPLVDPRSPIEETRGQVLLNLAIAYAQKGHYGLAQGIGQSLLHDPVAKYDADAAMALVDRAKEDLAPATRREIAEPLDALRNQLQSSETDAVLREYLALAKSHPATALSPLDRWDLYEGIGLVQIKARHFRESAEAFQQARTAAEQLPYPLLTESLYNLTRSQTELGQLGEALRTLEELLWVEALTRYDPSNEGRVRYAEKMLRDTSLARLRQRKELPQLLGKYGFATK